MVYLVIATSPNFPSRYYSFTDSDLLRVAINDLKYLCWHVEVKSIPMNDLSFVGIANERSLVTA